MDAHPECRKRDAHFKHLVCYTNLGSLVNQSMPVVILTDVVHAGTPASFRMDAVRRLCKHQPPVCEWQRCLPLAGLPRCLQSTLLRPSPWKGEIRLGACLQGGGVHHWQRFGGTHILHKVGLEAVSLSTSMKHRTATWRRATYPSGHP